MGGLSDPRLLGAAWANEERLANGQTETRQAREHSAEDRDAAKSRVTVKPKNALFHRVAGLLHRAR
jgi:hypothetical protein